jgi:hypothetical protein
MPIPGLSDLLNRRPKSGGRWIKFVTKCAWCKRTLRRERVWRDDPGAADEESHCLCDACLAKQMAALDKLDEKK